MDHEIFRTPHAVEPSLERVTAPDAYRRHGVRGVLPMWRVQTEGYEDGTDQLIGVVAGWRGFDDSPDTEWISGGVNTKGPEAVAIGRHGNFLHWGFAASPTYLTEEAKLVFVNAVHYIAKFDGQRPVGRKVSGANTRDRIAEMLDELTDEGYAERLADHERWVRALEEERAALRARLDAGEELTPSERRTLEMALPDPPDRLRYAKRYFPTAPWDELGEDVEAIRAWVEPRVPYLMNEGWYGFTVDETLMRLGVANDDPAMLERLVEGLDGDDPEACLAALRRYTEQGFTAPAEWSAWLAETEGHRFFTEVGGYVWLVDTHAVEKKAAQPPAPTDAEPVGAVLRLERNADGTHELVVAVRLLDGWHAYAPQGPGSPYVPMTVALELPPGVERVGEWRHPVPRPYAADPSLAVLEGSLEFRCTLEGASSGGEVVATLAYQVCDERRCLPPISQELRATLAGS